MWSYLRRLADRSPHPRRRLAVGLIAVTVITACLTDARAGESDDAAFAAAAGQDRGARLTLPALDSARPANADGTATITGVSLTGARVIWVRRARATGQDRTNERVEATIESIDPAKGTISLTVKESATPIRLGFVRGIMTVVNPAPGIDAATSTQWCNIARRALLIAQTVPPGTYRVGAVALIQGEPFRVAVAGDKRLHLVSVSEHREKGVKETEYPLTPGSFNEITATISNGVVTGLARLTSAKDEDGWEVTRLILTNRPQSKG